MDMYFLNKKQTTKTTKNKVDFSFDVIQAFNSSADQKQAISERHVNKC